MKDEIDINELWEKLTDSEKEAWTQIQNTIGSPGFKILRRDVESIGDSLAEAIHNVQNWDQYVFVKGQLNTLALFLNLQDRVLLQLQQAVAERQSASEEERPVEVPEDFA